MIRIKSWTTGFTFITFLTASLMAVSSSTYTTYNTSSNNCNDSDMNSFIDDLMSQMTLDEKCGQLTMSAGHWNNTGPVVKQGGLEDIKEGRIGSFLSVYGADMTYQLQKVAGEDTRLHIPLLFSHDVIHGFRTIFPVPIAQASSWDPASVEQAARIAAVEATASGVHWTYAPMVDIARDPRWGRIVEGWGEDPLLCSVMTKASVRGYQGDDLSREDTLLACAKHFVAYGTVEGGRDYNSGEITERTLREVYLPSFHAAVEAGVETFMPAFNDIGGMPSHANPYLMRNILRGEWRFKGLVVSDYTGIKELLKHGVAENPLDAGVRALKAGVDIDMLSDIYNDLPEAVTSGDLEISYIDEAVRRVLESKYKLGLFDDPYRYCSKEREEADSLTEEHRTAARKLAEKSIVLLKNKDAVLPLSKEVKSVAVIGPLADEPHSCLGSWAAAGKAEDAVTILSGLKAHLPNTEINYVKGCSINDSDTSGFDAATDAAKQADAVILVIGEHRDMSAEAKCKTSIDLPGVQRDLAKVVIATGKPVVVVLMNGRPLSIPWLEENAPAIVEAWYPGVEAGNAVARVLLGDVNPSGKLPVTFPRTVGQIPIYYNHRNTGRPFDAHDPYTTHYLDCPITPLYPFGYGLSYTTFVYDSLRLTKTEISKDESVDVCVNVTNTGNRKGTEVVQLYMRDLVGDTARPVKELRGFKRITLQPGETKLVQFTLKPNDFACYDSKMTWRVEPGRFQVFVGGNSVATLSKELLVEDK